MIEKGDFVMTKKSSSRTMLYYGKHREDFECPCDWPFNSLARVEEIRGDFLVLLLWSSVSTNCKKKSIFFKRDVSFYLTKKAAEEQYENYKRKQ